jgi:hypothetical protein
MAGFSDAMETEILNYILRGTAFTTLTANTTPANLYAALWIGDPLDTGAGGAEASYTSYARVALSRASGTWNSPTASGASMLCDNVAAITFPASTGGAAQTVTHIVIMSASSGGTQIFNEALAASRTINSGDAAPTFAIGALDVLLT